MGGWVGGWVRFTFAPSHLVPRNLSVLYLCRSVFMQVAKTQTQEAAASNDSSPAAGGDHQSIPAAASNGSRALPQAHTPSVTVSDDKANGQLPCPGGKHV